MSTPAPATFKEHDADPARFAFHRHISTSRYTVSIYHKDFELLLIVVLNDKAFPTMSNLQRKGFDRGVARFRRLR